MVTPVAASLAEVMAGNDGHRDRPRRTPKKRREPEAEYEALLVGLFRKLDVGYLYGRSVVKRTLCDEPQISVGPHNTTPIR